jgi:hypothetical protein
LRGELDPIVTSLVIDNEMYLDAVEVRIDQYDEPFYLDATNAERLIVMLTRDLEKLRMFTGLDPDSVAAAKRAAAMDNGEQR